MTYEELKITEILFRWQKDALYTGTHRAYEVVLEMGEFPVEQLWTIFVNGDRIESIDDLPPDWTVVKWATTEE